MKMKSGTTTTVKNNPIDELYSDSLDPQIMEECKKFSSIYYKLFNKFDKIIEGRKILNKEVQEIQTKANDNQEVLIKYIEDLILKNNNLEFMLPYYTICKNLNHDLDSQIAAHENHHFGVLGTVNEILGEGI
jgi:hypothetical protein